MNSLVANPIKVIIGIIPVIALTACNEKHEPVHESIFEPGISYNTFTDYRDQKDYVHIQIGNQIWMAQNLAYKAQKGCWAYDNDETVSDIYGYLYSWEAACKVCPNGWHLPSSAEFDSLIGFLGGPELAGGKMKRTGTYFWNSPNAGANNSSGFTALPGGIRYFYDDGWFDAMRDYAGFWTSSEFTVENSAIYVSLVKNSENVGSSFSFNNGLDWCDRNFGQSVRCIKDD